MGVARRFVGFVAGVGVIVSGAMVASPGFGADSETIVGDASAMDASSIVVDHRTGQVSTGFVLGSLPGLVGDGGVDLSLSYDQARVERGDVSGFGAGWDIAVTGLDIDRGAVRVFPASGGVFEADKQARSGLARYPGEDLRFHQSAGVVDVLDRDGEVRQIPYGFVLETLGGMREYFTAAGFLVVRLDGFGNAIVWEWDEASGHLLAVTDRAGNTLHLEWDAAGRVSLNSPARSDGVVPRAVVIDVNEEHGVSSVVDEMGETTVFSYLDGFLSAVRAPAGVQTRVTYQSFGGDLFADSIIARDPSGRVLSEKNWDPVGENLSTGFPKHANDEAGLWLSGDAGFRYATRVSDGAMDVVSVYNSMGVLVSQSLEITSGAGKRAFLEQQWLYPGTEAGGVPAAGAVPVNYNRPVELSTIFRDGDRLRTVTERSEYDRLGRVTSRTDPAGNVTTTRYNESVPDDLGLSTMLVREQIVMGTDGTVSKTVNTVSPDRKSVVATEVLTGTGSDLSSVNRATFVTEADGFVSEKTLSVPLGDDVVNRVDCITTRWSRTVDEDPATGAGTVVMSETTAAGTGVQTSTSTVSDRATGLMLRAVDATGRVSSTRYDGVGRPTMVTDFSGLSVVNTYHDHGLVTRSRTPDGIVKSSYRDALGRPVRTTNNVAANSDGIPMVSADLAFERTIEIREYVASSSRVTVSDATGHRVTTESDVFGRPVLSTVEGGLTQLSVYDDVANTVTTGVTIDPDKGLSAALRTSTRELDDLGREIRLAGQRQDGMSVPETRRVFDGLGRVAQSDARDIRNHISSNPDGTPRITTMTPMDHTRFPGNDVTVERKYNGMGTSVNKTLTTSRGEVAHGVAKTLDEQGRPERVVDQVGSVKHHVYTVDGLVLETVEDASGTVTRNSYDSVTRALTESEITRPGTESVRRAFDYDPVTGRTLAVFDPVDREKTQITYEYDVLGNQTSVRYPDGKTITQLFDVNGQKRQVSDVVGNTTRFEYNGRGLLAGSTQSDAAGEKLARVTYDYDSYGRADHVMRDNGVETRYTFTSADEIATERTVNAEGETVFDGAYSYDSHGNLVEKTVTQKHPETVPESHDDARGAHYSEATLPTITTSYSYDAYDRLTASREYVGTGIQGDPQKHTWYELSVTGSVTKETIVQRLADTEQEGARALGEENASVREFEYNALGQTLAILTDGVRAEQHYDAAGNLVVSADGTRYSYNALNRPTVQVASDGAQWVTNYWSTGHPRSESQGQASTELYWAGDTIVNETFQMGDGGVVSSYLFGAARVARSVSPVPERGGAERERASRTTAYFVSDRHGSVVAIVGSGRAPISSYEYTDYGRATVRNGKSEAPVVDNRFQYSGEYTRLSDETQLLGVRTYDPNTGAFTTRDTAPLYNLYAYGNANPITMVDPSGESAMNDFAANGVFAGMGTALSLLGFGSSLYVWGFRSMKMLVANATVGVFDLSVALAQATRVFAPHLEPRTSEHGSAVLGALAGLSGTVVGSVSGLVAYRNHALMRAIDRAVENSSHVAHELLNDVRRLNRAVLKPDSGSRLTGTLRADSELGPGKRFMTTAPETRFAFLGFAGKRDPSAPLEGPMTFMRDPRTMRFFRDDRVTGSPLCEMGAFVKVDVDTWNSGGTGRYLVRHELGVGWNAAFPVRNIPAFMNEHRIDVLINLNGTYVVRPGAEQEGLVSFFRLPHPSDMDV